MTSFWWPLGSHCSPVGRTKPSNWCSLCCTLAVLCLQWPTRSPRPISCLIFYLLRSPCEPKQKHGELSNKWKSSEWPLSLLCFLNSAWKRIKTIKKTRNMESSALPYTLSIFIPTLNQKAETQQCELSGPHSTTKSDLNESTCCCVF